MNLVEKKDNQELILEEKKPIEFNFEYLEKICYDLHIKSNGNLNIIKEALENLKITESVFIRCACEYINKNITKPEYVLVFENLLKLKTKDEVNKYLSSISFSLKYLQNNLMAYYFYFRPDIYFYRNDLKEKLNKMLNCHKVYLKLLDEPPLDIVNKSSLEYATIIIKNFIKSQTTLERYCFQNNITLQSFKTFLQKIKYTDNQASEKEISNLYIEYEKNILLKEEIKERDLKNEVLKILNQIKESGKLSLFEFSLCTKYGIKELIKQADMLRENENIISLDELKLLRSVLNNLLNVKRYQTFQIKNFYNNNDKFSFSINNELMELDTNTRKMIINFLMSNEVPITFDTIKFAYLFIIDENLYQSFEERENKQKIK